MNCDAIQSLIVRDDRGELEAGQSREIEAHLAECPDCREWLAFHRSLVRQMDNPVPVPPELGSKVAALIAESPRRESWLSRVLGNPTMKKLALSSTLALFAVAALMLAPRTASANNAIESFKKVRSSITRAVKQGEVKVKAVSDMKGNVTAEVTKDGVVLTGFPVDVQVQRAGNELDVRISLDLDPKNFAVIRYGKQANTLELIRKNDPSKVIRVGMDPKSQIPTSWSQEAIEVQGFPLEFDEKGNIKDPNPSSAPKKVTSGMEVHIKMQLGQTAIATIQSGS